MSEILNELGKKYFGGDIQKALLKGDGSDRRIFRLFEPDRPDLGVIGVIHQDLNENSQFFEITRAMQSLSLPVPEIFMISQDQTAYLLEDLGPFTLAEKIELWNGSQDKEKIRSAYMEVLKNLVIMQFQLPELLKGLLSKNPMNYAAFQGDVAYFRRNYLDCFGFGKEFSHQVEAEITDNLIGPLSRLEDKYFIYRDFQSRNIMWLEDKPWFIDYQSAMKGSLYYDPASLFFASKAGLDDEMIDELLLGYYHLLESPVTFEEFNRNFYLFVLLRRLRSLGSYGYLSQVKGKSQFYAAILPTLDQLAKILNQGFFESDFYHLLLMVKRLGELWKEKSAG